MHQEDEWGMSAPMPPPLADTQSLDLSMSLEKKNTLSDSDLERLERRRRECDIVEYDDAYHHWWEQERELGIERRREKRRRRKQMWITRNQLRNSLTPSLSLVFWSDEKKEVCRSICRIEKEERETVWGWWWWSEETTCLDVVLIVQDPVHDYWLLDNSKLVET